jgi:hypothetical protein
MGEVIRFIRNSQCERARLIREARAIYESIFPSNDTSIEQPNAAPVHHTVGGANARRGDGVLLP